MVRRRSLLRTVVVKIITAFLCYIMAYVVATVILFIFELEPTDPIVVKRWDLLVGFLWFISTVLLIRLV